MVRVPRQAVILARISDARDGDSHGVDGQVADCRAHAARIGWQCGPPETHLVIENDTSAFKRKRIRQPDGSFVLRTVRPGFQQALAMLRAGDADGLIVLDLDRACRDPRDLEDLIDVVESSRPRVLVESVTGSLRLANDADVAMARVQVAIGNKASRDTGRRVEAARKRNAEAGRFGGGVRPFGFEADGVTIRQSEAAEIKNAADALLAGVPVRQIVAGLRLRGIPTVTGTTWKPTILREILRRPRNAGILVYQDEEIGKAPWPAILPEPTWHAVKAIFKDQARRSTPGNTPRWLGSGLYLCGVCRETVAVRGAARGGRGPSYRCEHSHVTRAAGRLDEYVSAVLVAWLSRPEAAELLTPPSEEPDMLGLRSKAVALRELLNEQARMHANGVIDAQQLAAGSRELRGKLTAIELRLASAIRRDPLAGIAGRSDAEKVWAGLDLGRKRAMLAALCTVTLRPAVHGRLPGGSYLDTDAVHFDWYR